MFLNLFFIIFLSTNICNAYNDIGIIKQKLNVEEYINSCGIYYPPKGFITAGINYDRYYNGTMCGDCIQGTIDNKIKFKAVINDLCSECKSNQISINYYSQKKVKKMPVVWQSIDCPKKKPSFITESSNSYYCRLKIFDIGKIKNVKINNINAIRTYDNYWFVFDINGLLGCGAHIELTTWDLKVIKHCLDKTYFGGFCPNKKFIC